MHSVRHPEGPLGVAVEIMMFGVANIGVETCWVILSGVF